MSGPDFIDNRNGNTLAKALVDVLSGKVTGAAGGLADGGTKPPPAEVAIASAFFSPAGFAHIADALMSVPRVRLLLGAEPPLEAQRARRNLNETEREFERRRLNDGLRQLDKGLRAERDRLPFTPASSASLKKLIKVLKTGCMEVRRYEDAFLHAKAYIFAPDPEAYGAQAGVIAGSSNLTGAGLSRNLELNLGRYDHPIVKQAQDWFEDLWDKAVPFDLVALFEEVFAEWLPWDVFLRVLWQLYGSEIELDAEDDRKLPLTSFQKHGVARALRLMRERGGVIVADEVGLGKTFIAGEIVTVYQARRQRALLICPAALRDTTWKKFRARFELYLEIVSFEELANDRQIKATLHEKGGTDRLERDMAEYQLVIVDEAHNYRNPDAPTRARVLRQLLFGQKRDLLLLTATPVNNSLWDLFHLIRFFLKQDSHLADRGILSIRERFEHAMRIDPTSLSPDLLYPIVDATTVKRTRQFVKKHYTGDNIVGPEGKPIPIVFPEPRALTVRYDLDAALPGFFDKVADAIEPDDDGGSLSFARYLTESFRKEVEDSEEELQEEINRGQATAGLLRSALLKRFESSAEAFRCTVAKMLSQHDTFLDALAKGRVITTKFLNELAADDEIELEEMLALSDETYDAKEYDASALRAAVEADREILQELLAEAKKLNPSNDPKLKALVAELEKIAADAEREGTDAADETQKRKVLIFSSFADTVRWIRAHLGEAVKTRPGLARYRNRVVAIAGTDDMGDGVSRLDAVYGFAPVASEAPSQRDDDLYDILVTTDILAEGVNLQQARHIVNFDMPWNPMRLVQRHGRIDRIGSEHTRVFLRTVFPDKQLDRLLNLEQRILNKLAMAAASVGVMRPIEHGPEGDQVFTETREEIEKLLHEDASLYERGGTVGAAQTGEEYRQSLRKALEINRERVVNLPWKAGSGMRKGKDRGVFFCAAIGDRTFLRFVPATADWKPTTDTGQVIREVGTCLRLIECDETTARYMPPALDEGIFGFWEAAQKDIQAEWDFQTDPANLQPKVRPLNLRVAEFIRANPPVDIAADRVTLALDVLESPWPRREEMLLRQWFNDESQQGAAKAKDLVERIIDTGLEPYRQPPVMPPIRPEDIELICWMVVEQE
jgi:hypothetical protein